MKANTSGSSREPDGVSRRAFLAQSGLSTTAIVAGGMALPRRTTAEPLGADHFVPEDKLLTKEWLDLLTAKGGRKVFRGEERETIGMPCGGICAGQLYVLGDGTLGYWWIANNTQNTGYGHHHSIETPLGDYPVTYTPQPFTPPRPVEQGFALRVDDRVWQLNSAGFSDIGFVGEYPIAEIRYERARGEQPPVEVRSEVFSPFLPLNARDSANPATILRYTVKNTSSESHEVSIGGWLQNPVMLTERDAWKADHRNQVVRGDEWVGVCMDVIPRLDAGQKPARTVVFDDFETGYGKWTIEGDAFGEKPVEGTLPGQQPVSGQSGKYVNTYLGSNDRMVGTATSKEFTIELPYVWFLIAGGNFEAGRDRTTLELLVDGKVVRSACGKRTELLEQRYWDVAEFRGRKARLRMVDANRGGWGHICVDSIIFADQPAPASADYDPEHQHLGNLTIAALDAPSSTATVACASKDAFLAALVPKKERRGPRKSTYRLGERRVAGVATTERLAPGESRTFDFVLGWYFPNRRADDVPIYGRHWGEQVGHGAIVGNRYNKWYSHSAEVVGYLARHFYRLTRGTYLFRDTLYDTSLPYWLVQRLSMPLANLASETMTWREDGWFWAWEGVGCCVGNCGHVWNYAQGLARLFPELERSVRLMQDFDPERGFDAGSGAIFHRGLRRLGWAADGMGGYILKTYREHLCSPDNAFLAEVYPRLKKSVEFMTAQDGLDGQVDGFLEGRQHNTYDIDYYGANTLVGAMYHGALRAAARMATAMGDVAFAEHCTRLADRGAKSTMERIWREDWGYFVQDVDLAKHPRNQQGDGCLADQLFGQSFAHQVGLGHLYPRHAVRKTMESIFKYNWAPDVGPQNKEHPPERWYCRPGEAGLFMCTWPKTRHLGPHSVRYRDEVWTGTEYQVAANMFYEGMTTEPLAIIRAIHERYDGVRHNPWNEIECGDHYARALASWGCLLGVSGFEYDGPRGHMGFAPKLQPEDFKCFFSGAEGWGSYAQKQDAGIHAAELEVASGWLRLKTLRLELPGGTTASAVACELGGRRREARFQQEGRSVLVAFPAGLNVRAGSTLAVRVTS